MYTPCTPHVHPMYTLCTPYVILTTRSATSVACKCPDQRALAFSGAFQKEKLCVHQGCRLIALGEF